MPITTLAVAGLAISCWVGMFWHHFAGGHHTSTAEPAIFSHEYLAWMFMVGAMMLPTTFEAVNDVSRRSYRRRRFVAAMEYIAGYLAWWAVLGAVFAVVRVIPAFQHRYLAVIVGFLASVWMLVPARRIWFAQCHRQIPLCPVGWRADWDAFNQGLVHGMPCVKMCWLLMLACGFSGHNWILMIGGTILAVHEMRMFRLDRTVLFVGSLILSALLLTQIAIEPLSLFHMSHDHQQHQQPLFHQHLRHQH